MKWYISAAFLFVLGSAVLLDFMGCGSNPASSSNTPAATATPTATPSAPSQPTTISTGTFLPYAVRTAPNGNLWVLQFNNPCALEEITPAGATVAGPVTAFNGSATFFYPEGIAVDSPGNVYVADYENKKVELFNSLGTWQETFASAQLAGSFDEGIAVNNAGTFTFLAFSVAAGSFDSNGNLWVADHTNGRVVKYNAAGVYQSAVTLQGTAPYAVDVAVDPSGNIFATENHNNTLQEFNAAGQWLYTVTGTVAAPRGLSLDPTRTYLYVADNGSNQIVRFKIH